MSGFYRWLANPVVRFYRDLWVTSSQQGISKLARLLPGAKVLNSVLSDYSSVGHDAEVINTELGAYSYVSAGARVANCKIGPFCSIGNKVFIAPGIHPSGLISTHPIFYSSAGQCGTVWLTEPTFNENLRATVGADVWIGLNAIVLDGVNVGVGAIIGAGAVVTKDVPPYAVVLGVPAKIVKYRFEASIIERLILSKWWLVSPKLLRDNISVFSESPEKFLDWIERVEQ